MNSKVVSFQLVPPSMTWQTPDVIALCQDGSLWIMSLEHYSTRSFRDWKRLTPEIEQKAIVTPGTINHHNV